MIDYGKFSEEEIHKLKEEYVGNECDTDEYRETQPFKGLYHVCRALELLEDDIRIVMQKRNAEEQQGVINSIRQRAHWLANATGTWAQAYGGGYEGCDKLEPVLAEVFDIMREHRLHPYFDTDEEVREYLYRLG